ncbi:WD40 repeat-like protein [Lentinus tigrinus ALCF2SS1-6]|uniref:WD40 repeat-like protein n=1 Tax=Lentinus tigrinus ALCF2SS1-6 TaxID=1328759 RepID=A0A5C2RXR4_9APHY|nr:WD40 repeat-like protein [Lentinus tigrinus ALCF2SS1-6]
MSDTAGEEQSQSVLDFFGGAGATGRERLQGILDAILELQGVSTRDNNGNSISASLTNEDLQRLLTVFASRDSGGGGGGGDGSRNVTLVSQDDQDDDDDPDYVDEEEVEEEEEDDYSGYFYGFGYPASQRHWDRSGWWPEITEPQKEGLELLFGGEFGRIMHQMKARDRSKNIARNILNRGASFRPTCREDIASEILPNSSGTAVASYAANAYVGQFSSDSAFYYTCVRNFRLHVYDMKAPFKPRPLESRDGHATTMEIIKTIQAAPGRWTITDSHLSPDNQRMIYASISSTVHMTSTLDASTEQIPISFKDPVPRGSRYDYWEDDEYGIWSCKFSADGNEVIAGGNKMIFVYDLLADRRTVKIEGHSDDVNTCCWADTASGNVLISGSDDTFVKVWDRRSLGGTGKPSGVLIGHTEGITYVSAKGDGRYVISNGKDQILRLWDLRMMRSNSEFEAAAGRGRQYGIPGYDYRGDAYPRPRYKAHPLDCSVMKYTGHEVLRTLIRCHFSPAETTGQQYIYSGSSDGKIHIWSLDGRVVQVLDRSYTLPMALDPSGPDPQDITPARVRPCVRDVSWHSQEPVLMSTGWLGRRWGHTEGSIVARHEWKGMSKVRGGLEDWVERRKTERAERAQRRAQRRDMPGALTAFSVAMLVTSDKEAKALSVQPLDAELTNYGFPQGYFMLRSIGTGRMLDVCQGFKEDGTAVILWPMTESSFVESMRRPECNNQVFFIDTSGAFCSRSAGHAIDVEEDNLVIRHRRPVTLPFPNSYSHALPRFAYNADTKEITVTFASDPSYPAAPESRRESISAAWKEKTYYLSSIPVRKPPTIIDNASAFLTSAMSGPLALFGGQKTNATPDMVFDGEIDLAEGELAEQDRNEAEEVDDSPEPLRPVKVVALMPEEVVGSSDAARLRRQWEILPLRNTKSRTGT